MQKNKYRKYNIIKMILKITFFTLGGVTIVSIIFNLVININYGNVKNIITNQTINNIIINNKENIIISDLSENDLLRIAQSRYESEDYQGAIEIYQLDKMQNNDIAMSNLGFLYTNYYDINDSPNYDKILATYNKSNHIQSYRNKLAFYIKYGGYVEENTLVSYEDMYNILQYLLYEENDNITKNYVINCGNENGKDYNQDDFVYDYDFSIFYCYRDTDHFFKGSIPPNNLNGYWVLKSWDSVIGEGVNHITGTWQLLQYKFMDELEKFIFVD